jgi:hypothetical protein
MCDRSAGATSTVATQVDAIKWIAESACWIMEKDPFGSFFEGTQQCKAPGRGLGFGLQSPSAIRFV